DLDAVDRVHRLAFGTQFGLKDPSQFRGDAQLARTRYAADPSTCFVAEKAGRIIGSVFGMDWGWIFIVGPLSVDPAHWRGGVGRVLMDRLIALIDERRPALAGLFTFPSSPTHIRLYESYGFVPNTLTPIMTKPVAPPASAAVSERYSVLSPANRDAALAACHGVAGSVFPGLDLSREIEAIAAQSLGETLLLGKDGAAGFALCHVGPGSEAGSGNLFVKFAACQPGDLSSFERLLGACEVLARAKGVRRIVAGCNVARAEAYGLMQSRGFRAEMIGVAMHRPGGIGYNRPGLFVIDDWR
ncbi:MAG: GNAT family N-acetyltransferase, partial [Stellaceae bacterium]